MKDRYFTYIYSLIEPIWIFQMKNDHPNQINQELEMVAHGMEVRRRQVATVVKGSQI